MNKFKTLLKFRLKYKLGISQIKYMIKNNPNGKLYFAGFAFLALFIILSLTLPYFFILQFLYDASVQLGNTNMVIGIVILAGQFMLFISGLFFAFNSMFSNKEGDFLSPLPFKK